MFPLRYNWHILCVILHRCIMCLSVHGGSLPLNHSMGWFKWVNVYICLCLTFPAISKSSSWISVSLEPIRFRHTSSIPSQNTSGQLLIFESMLSQCTLHGLVSYRTANPPIETEDWNPDQPLLVVGLWFNVQMLTGIVTEVCAVVPDLIKHSQCISPDKVHFSSTFCLCKIIVCKSPHPSLSCRELKYADLLCPQFQLHIHFGCWMQSGLVSSR